MSLYFLGCTAPEIMTYLLYVVMVSSVQKDWHVKGKNLSGIIHSSNKKSHKTLGLLPKSMDYIIE